MAWYKEYAGKACNWFVCISHLLELPLRRVAKLMMGETSGPNGFKSELGKKIQDLHVIPVKFEAIPCEEFPNLEEGAEMRERERDREREREREREGERETNRHRQTDRQTDRHSRSALYRLARFMSLSTSESFREGGVQSALQDRKAKPRLEKKADFVG